MISSHQDTLERDGYLLLRGLLDRSIIDGVLRRVEDAVDLRAQKLHEDGAITDLHQDAPVIYRWQRIFQDMGNYQSRRSWDEDVISEELYTLMAHPPLRDVLEPIVGPNITATGLIALRPKVPNDKRTTVLWHQDSHYFGPDTADMTILTVWVPLVDTDETNGCMQIVPGSHTWGYVDAEMDPDHKAYRPLQDPTERGDPISCEMKVGDVLIFRNLTLHRSLPNTSDHTRWSIDFRYHGEGVTFARADKYIPGFRARGGPGPEPWQTWITRYRESGIHTE
jgi:ectoine hydroxylase-related dioxygenase (phytanoyl-CoA dioxygenase family)